jgi:hypothetical protein
MDTHDEMNKAGPQKEISSGFKSGPISQDINAQRSSGASSQDGISGVPSKTPTAGLWHRRESNPYRLTQPSGKGNQNQQLEVEPLEKGTRSGLMKQIKDKLFPKESGVSSTKQKAMVVLVPILAIVMIFVLRQVLTKAPRKTDGATSDNMPEVILTDNSNDDINWQIPEPLPVVMRDPTKIGSQNTSGGQSGISGGTQSGIMIVKGILYSYDKPSVVIGGHIVHLNEKINDATVVEINKDCVVFEKDGKRWTRKVAESELDQEEYLQEEPNQEEQE